MEVTISGFKSIIFLGILVHNRPKLDFVFTVWKTNTLYLDIAMTLTKKLIHNESCNWHNFRKLFCHD